MREIHFTNHHTPAPSEQRRLAALMFTDMVGYSKLCHKDEAAAKTVMEEMYRIVRETTARYAGRELDTAGDGFFLEFHSAVSAIECAYEIQARIFESNLQHPPELQLRIRIGLHICDFIETADGVIGDDVNITARLEKIAEPGGIAVSRQLVEQVKGKFKGRFESIGPMHLRNIERKVHVHRVVMPWAVSRRFGLATRLRASLRAPWEWLGLGAMACVALIACLYLADLLARNVHVPPGAEAISLESGWQIRSANAPNWEPFDANQRGAFAGRVSNHYFLRKSFTTSRSFSQPTLVLGYIPDRYRIYLNDQWIGGADRLSPVEYFSFNSALLKPGSENLIQIEAWTIGTVFPGLNIAPSVGAFLSELDHAYAVIHRDRILYHGREIAILAISGLLFAVCLLAWLLRPSDRTMGYQTAYLFGCVLLSTHYVFPIFSGEPYWIFGLFKNVPLSVCPLILVSSYLAARGARKLELANNFLFLAAVTGTVWSLGWLCPGPMESLFRQNRFYIGSAIYGSSTALFALAANARAIHRKASPGSRPVMIGWMVAFFNLSTSLFALFGIYPKPPFDFLRDPRLELSMVYPLLFSLAVAWTGVWDYARKSREARGRQRLLEGGRKLLSTLVDNGDFHSQISAIQRTICEFTDAGKSTLYLATYSAEGLVLHTESMIRDCGQLHLVPSEIRGLTSGILGYACQTRSPLLIEDLALDARFPEFAAKSARDGYTTRSCMIFPLVSGSRLLGVITFADRKTRTAFARADFDFAHQASQFLRLLCERAPNNEQRSPTDVNSIKMVPRAS